MGWHVEYVGIQIDRKKHTQYTKSMNKESKSTTKRELHIHDTRQKK